MALLERFFWYKYGQVIDEGSIDGVVSGNFGRLLCLCYRIHLLISHLSCLKLISLNFALEIFHTLSHSIKFLSKMPAKPMTKDASSRIQASEANKGGGQVESGGFASRAQVTELLQVLIVKKFKKFKI